MNANADFNATVAIWLCHESSRRQKKKRC